MASEMEQNPDIPDLSGLSEEEQMKLLSVIKKAKVIRYLSSYPSCLKQINHVCFLKLIFCLQVLSTEWYKLLTGIHVTLNLGQWAELRFSISILCQ